MKKHSRTLHKRGLALFLALVMCFGMLQTTAWADENDNDSGDTIASNTDSRDISDANDNGGGGSDDQDSSADRDSSASSDDSADRDSGGDSSDDSDDADNDSSHDDSSEPSGSDDGGDDAEDKDTPDTYVGGDENVNAGDTEPSNNPDHAAYPWAEEKDWPRGEDVIIDPDHEVTVPVTGETTEGEPDVITGGTSKTDTWEGEGSAELNWTEQNEDGKDVKVEVDVNVSVENGTETTTDTTISDSLGIHQTNTVNGSETVKTEIDRTETVENPDEVDLFDTENSAEVSRPSVDDDYTKLDMKPEPDKTIINKEEEALESTASLTISGKNGDTATNTTTVYKSEIVKELQESAVNSLGAGKEKKDDKTWVEVTSGENEGDSTTVTVTMKDDGYEKKTETVTSETKKLSELEGAGSHIVDGQEVSSTAPTAEEMQEAWGKLYEAQVGKLAEAAGGKVEAAKDENGKYTETRIDITDDAGKVIGYYSMKPSYNDAGEMTSYQLTKVVEKNDTAAAQDIITLPERPVESVTTAENGEETRVEVQDRLDANGNVIGYVKITTVTRPSGSVSTKTEVLSGTKTSASTTAANSTHTIITTVDNVVLNAEDSTITTWTKVTETETAKVTGDDITNTVTVTLGTISGTNTDKLQNTATPDMSLDPDDGKINTTTDLYGRKDTTILPEDMTGYDFYLTGEYGLESAIRISSNNYDPNNKDDTWGASTWQAHQFVLSDSASNKFYVYCADFSVSPEQGTPYNMQNVSDATYYDSDAANHILAIANNGYWGTADSLATLNKKLGTNLTPGQALAITQAAIWYYGNSGTSGSINSNPIGSYYYGDNNGYNKNYAESEEGKMLTAAFNKLIKLTEKPSNSLITANDIANAITRTAEVTSDSNGNTSATVKLNLDANVASKLVSGQLGISAYDSKGNAVQIQMNEDGSFTLNTAGTYTIKLTATQTIAQGAYLFSAATKDTSQTFVGIASGTRSFELEFQLTFDGEKKGEMQIETEHQTGTQYKDDYAFALETEFDTTDVTETHIETETLRQWSARTVETNTYVYGDDDDDDDDRRRGDDDADDDGDDDVTEVVEDPAPLVEVPETPTPLASAEAIEDVEVPEERVPLAEAPAEEEEEVEIPEDDVPLAEVPATGDISGMWYAMTLLAACGIAVLSVRKKEQDA